MGTGSWSAKTWASYSNARGIDKAQTVSQIYQSNSINASLSPFGVTFRESCDSEEHPNSTPIIVGLDVTGSMGSTAMKIAQTQLNTFITETMARTPVTDPQIMIAAIGDAYTDEAPFQTTQFESDIRIAEQLKDIFFEGHGGGNGGESYLLTWYFAARHTKTDAFLKHNKKGFLFTIGDEPPHLTLTKEQIKEVFGDDVEGDLSAEELLIEASRKYEVFHLVVKEYWAADSLAEWEKLLKGNAMKVENEDCLAQLMESIMEVKQGKSIQSVTDSWDGSTAIVLKQAMKNLTTQDKTNNSIVVF